jgi:archaellum component FlaC
MLNRISQGSSYRAIDDFVTSFTQLAMSRPLDNDVQMIILNQDRNYMLQGINDTLVDRLADNVGRSITRAMTPVSDSMDRFIIGATRNQIDGVNHIVARFLDEMDRSLGNQFSAMATAMDAVTQNQIMAARQTGETVSAAQGIVDNARSLQEMTNHILDKFDAYMNGINQVRERDENYEKRTAELLNRMQQENKDLAVLIESLAKNISALTADSGDSSLKEIRGVMSSMEESIGHISSTLAAIAEED